MSTTTQMPLVTFADWIRETDDHAAHHLALVDKAVRLLETPGELTAQHRGELASRLERWRYQHLNEHARMLTDRDEAFVDSLDRTAKQLTGQVREPRRTRHAIDDAGLDTAAMDEALETLLPGYPLDELVRRATQLTQENFAAADASGPSAGTRRMLLYAPVYVSSECVNYCTYCGFRYPQQITRRHLSVDEVVEQARILRHRGFRHLLVVGGDFPSRTSTDYYEELTVALVREGIEPAAEIAAQNTQSYAKLVAAGICGLTLYQETYNDQLYTKYHVRGPKSSYHWRLEAHDRAAEAGTPRLGLGILLGLAEPREDLLAMMRHARYLGHRFPDCCLAFSLPRIHEAPPRFQLAHPVSDEKLVRLYCALRIAFPEATLVLSTREPTELRNRLARICITQMSAGSSTAPGGYRDGAESVGEQFPVVDSRSPTEVAQWLAKEGFSVCWSVQATRPCKSHEQDCAHVRRK